MKTGDYGICNVCEGPINAPQQWKLTTHLLKVHADPEDCFAKLHPGRWGTIMRVERKHQYRRSGATNANQDHDAALRPRKES